MGSECQPQKDRFPAVFVPTRPGVGRLGRRGPRQPPTPRRATPGRVARRRPPHHGNAGEAPAPAIREAPPQTAPVGRPPHRERGTHQTPPARHAEARRGRPRPGTYPPGCSNVGGSTTTHILLTSDGAQHRGGQRTPRWSTKYLFCWWRGEGRAGGPIERATPVFGACRLPVGRLGPLRQS